MDWTTRRRAVLQRARWRCECAGCVLHAGPCGSKATDVDHVEAGDNHELANLQALCRACHGYKTGTEARARRPRD